MPEQESPVVPLTRLELNGGWCHVINREHQRAAKCAMLRYVPDGLPLYGEVVGEGDGSGDTL